MQILIAMRTLAAIVAALALLAVAGVHVYWGMGGAWPAKRREDLAPMVVGSPPGVAMPSTAMTLGVAAFLLCAALLPLIASGLLPSPLPMTASRAATIALASVLLARGLFGFIHHKVRPASVQVLFDRLNRRLYSPLCLALAALVGAALA